ncbi:hypothetical protein ACFVWN_00805 [Nocardiopsis flavescens]|uniref:hypothetical protein n=1 Tax=Nocardiopsis flavescens TaxID=758803 RepID=UPI003669377C
MLHDTHIAIIFITTASAVIAILAMCAIMFFAWSPDNDDSNMRALTILLGATAAVFSEALSPKFGALISSTSSLLREAHPSLAFAAPILIGALLAGTAKHLDDWLDRIHWLPRRIIVGAMAFLIASIAAASIMEGAESFPLGLRSDFFFFLAMMPAGALLYLILFEAPLSAKKIKK